MPLVVKIDAAKISDWENFHDVFADAFGFPGLYGRNLDAMIDCLCRLDEEFSRVQAQRGEIVTLILDNADTLKERAPEVLQEIFELAALVNWRRYEQGDPAILSLACQP